MNNPFITLAGMIAIIAITCYISSRKVRRERRSMETTHKLQMTFLTKFHEIQHQVHNPLTAKEPSKDLKIRDHVYNWDGTTSFVFDGYRFYVDPKSATITLVLWDRPTVNWDGADNAPVRREWSFDLSQIYDESVWEHVRGIIAKVVSNKTTLGKEQPQHFLPFKVAA